MGSVTTEGLRLLVFNNKKTINEHGFLDFDAGSNYDTILWDFLTKVGLKLDHKKESRLTSKYSSYEKTVQT